MVWAQSFCIRSLAKVLSLGQYSAVKQVVTANRLLLCDVRHSSECLVLRDFSKRCQGVLPTNMSSEVRGNMSSACLEAVTRNRTHAVLG